MPNILSGTSSGSAPTQIDVDTVTKEVVAENYSRVGLVLTNLSDGTMYISFGTNGATLNTGIPILPGGGTFNMEDYTYTKEAVNAIAHSSNALMAIQEFVVRG